MKRKALVVLLAVVLSSCGDSPTAPTQQQQQQQPQPIQNFVCNAGSCNTNAPANPAPGTTGATCPSQVLSVGINVPASISLAQGNSYVADATPHGPDGKAFPVGCSPLPPVTWFVSAACRVGDDAAFRTLLAGVSLGVCQLNAVVSGVSSPNKTVQVVP